MSQPPLTPGSGDLPTEIRLTYLQSARLFARAFQELPAYREWCRSHAEHCWPDEGAIAQIMYESWLANTEMALAFRAGQASRADEVDALDTALEIISNVAKSYLQTDEDAQVRNILLHAETARTEWAKRISEMQVVGVDG